jgi:peroxidase
MQFIMHDVTYSQDSKTEFIDVPMPDDEEEFYKNTTLRVWRTEAVPGTGTSTDNPRENINMATTWLDISSLYGSTPEVAAKLRSYKGGELLTQRIKTRGNQKKGEYLPYNTMNVPARTRPGVNPSQLFAGGDARTNEDWMMLGVHTLMVREHNRLCKILAKQHPEYDDERLYQTIRLVLAGKYALIANSYQMAYWTDKMPWPRDDGT